MVSRDQVVVGFKSLDELVKQVKCGNGLFQVDSNLGLLWIPLEFREKGVYTSYMLKQGDLDR